MSLSIFRPSPESTQPVGVNSEIGHRIIESVEAAGLDLERCMLVGSAALALYGITLGPDEHGSPRPSDADLAASPFMMHELFEDGETSTGVNVRLKDNNSSRTTLRIDTPSLRPDLLPIDLITRVNTSDEARNVRKFDKKFITQTLPQASSIIPGTRIRLATPAHIAKDLKLGGVEDIKAANDLRKLREHFPDQRL